MLIQRKTFWIGFLMVWIDRVWTWQGFAVEVTRPRGGKLVTRRRYPWKVSRKTSIKPFFRWYDLWVGVYVDHKNHAVYICPIPMFGIKVQL
jgi:hypothetical protein